ncbi:hypothetical protein ACWD3I_49130 [Streptomyces sp. NPDC002817]
MVAGVPEHKIRVVSPDSGFLSGRCD